MQNKTVYTNVFEVAKFSNYFSKIAILKVWSWDQQPGNRMERQIPGPTLVLLAGLLWGRGVQPPTCTDPLVTVMHSGCSITELCIECA